MGNIYLDKDKKNYYYSDFTDNVLADTDNFWKISELIKSHLIELNECKKIQPLYSKFPNNGQNESYLELAYIKDIELILFREILPYFIIRYTQGEAKFYYTFSKPKDNPNIVSGKSKFKMGCLINPDYFRINHLRLLFEEYNKDKHKEFWKELTNKLKQFA